ncbi:hypothetical protein BBJ28_00003224 [Nothophytophthora sp. Chile5]|nr:hypothetical protein BBJ28_00003224 [Nothophytophthora sp. Chile5]
MTADTPEEATAPASTPSTASAAASQRKFGAKWELKYAIAVTERDPLTHAPTVAVCLMCQAFEKDEAVGAKRKKTSRVRRFASPWRPDNMKRHMEQQHAVRWSEYQTLGDSEKRAFFSSGRATRENLVLSATGGDVASMASEPAPSAAASVVAAQSRSFLVDRDIVSELVGDVLFEAASGDRRNGWNAPGAAAGFTLQEEASPEADSEEVDLNESRYVARVDSLLQFNLCLKYVAMGISFSQVVPLYQTTVEETGMEGSLNGTALTEQQIASLCRVACAVNLQTLKDALRSGVWAFAIVLESGNGAGSPYLDVRVRFERNGTLHNFHLIAIPIREEAPQTGEHQNNLVVKCLDVVAPEWKSQLIGISTDGSAATKMPACARALVERLARECVAPVFCEWGAAQQLEQVVQEAFNALCNKRFMSALTSLTGHLRRQRALIREMNGDTCPKFEEGQWRSMARVLQWFAEKRVRLIRFIEETRPACAPGLEWWVTVLAVNSVVDRVNVTLAHLRGPITQVARQRECLMKLVTDLAALTGALGPLTASQRVSVAQSDYEVGDFTLSPDATLSFLKEQGSFAINAVDYLVESYPACCQASVDSTAHFALSIIARAHRVAVDSDENNSSTTNTSTSVPPFLPNVLCKMRNQVFVTELQQQRVRLQKRFTVEQIEQIEAQHRNLRTAYQLEEHVSQQLDTLSTSASFSEAWKDRRFGGKDCRLLREFCGAIASAASTPNSPSSGAEAEFSLINWRRSPFGLSLIDFSLEAILHAQQYRTLSRLREC